MEIQELKNIWQAYDDKLERSFRLNMHCLEMIQSQKAKSRLRPLLIIRIIEMALHVAVIIFLGKFLFHHFFEWAYAISATALIAFFAIAFINCIKQIELIKEIDYSKSITDIQTKLTLLQAHIVDYVRLTFLAIPTYLAYPILAFKALTNLDIVTLFATKWWTAQIIFSLLIIPVCVWLYRQVSYKNLHKKWVHFIIKNSVGNAVSNAMQFIKEIDEYKKENTQ